jgi:hypothetical protein
LPGGTSYQGGKVKLRIRPETPLEGKPPLRTEPLELNVTLDGTPIGDITVEPGSDFTEYTLDVPAGTAKTETDPDYALLHIYSPTWSGASAGFSADDRPLGVQVDQVIIEP